MCMIGKVHICVCEFRGLCQFTIPLPGILILWNRGFQLKQKLVISSWLLGQEALRIYLSLPPVLQQLEFDAAIFSPFYKFRGIRTWVWMLTQFHCWFHWGFDVVVFGRLELRSFGKKKHNWEHPLSKVTFGHGVSRSNRKRSWIQSNPLTHGAISQSCIQNIWKVNWHGR